MTIHLHWTKDLSVGDESIDAQHKQMLDYINKILDAIVFGVDAKQVQDNMFVFLGAHIKEHFSFEENYMMNIGYPGFKKHRQKHLQFTKKYIKFKEKFTKGADKEKLIIEIENFLSVWWRNHVMNEDKQYQIFLNKKQKAKKQ